MKSIDDGMKSIDDLRAKISEAKAKGWRERDRLKNSFSEAASKALNVNNPEMNSALSDFIIETDKAKQRECLVKVVEYQGVSDFDIIGHTNALLEEAAKTVLNLKLDEQALVKPVVDKKQEDGGRKSPFSVVEGAYSDSEYEEEKPEVTPENVILEKMDQIVGLANSGDISSEVAIKIVQECLGDEYHLNPGKEIEAQVDAFMVTCMDMKTGNKDNSIQVSKEFKEMKKEWERKIKEGDRRVQKVVTNACETVKQRANQEKINTLSNKKVLESMNAIIDLKEQMHSAEALMKSGDPRGKEGLDKAKEGIINQEDIINKDPGITTKQKKALTAEITSAKNEHDRISVSEKIKGLCKQVLDAHKHPELREELITQKDNVVKRIDKLEGMANGLQHKIPDHKQALGKLRDAIGGAKKITEGIRGKLIQEANNHIKDADPDAAPESPSAST